MAVVGRFLILVFLFALLSICALGQDLGSSNDLFGGKKKSAKKTEPVAKPTPTKPATAKPKATKPKANTAKASPAKKKTSPVKPKPVAKPATAASEPKKSAPDTTTSAKSTTPKQASAKPAKSSVTKPKSAPKVAATKPKPAPKTVVTQPKPVVTEPKSTVATSKPIPTPKPPEVTVASNPAADELFEKLIVDGNAARDERNYTAAESAYKRAKNVKPKDSRAVYGLGNLYSDQQRWEEAENSYREAIKIEPANPIINVALSYVLSQPIIGTNLSDRYAEAEKLARKASELAPSNALAFDQLGVAMELGGLISNETEDAYRKSIRLDPSFTPAYAHLGRLLHRQGKKKESAAAYESAVKRSTDPPTMILVAEVMQSDQRYSESEPLLRRAVEEDPKNPAGLLLLGKALTTLGEYADAEKFLRTSLTVSPNAFMPNRLLAELYARQKKYELAENALLQALRFVSPNEKRNLSLQFEMVGDGYKSAGNPGAAERVYKQAVALDPERETLRLKNAGSKKK